MTPPPLDFILLLVVILLQVVGIILTRKNRYPVVSVEEEEETETLPAEVYASDCEKAYASVKERAAWSGGYDKRCVLITMLSDIRSSYSVTNIVIEQARALAARGWMVEIWTCVDCTDRPPDLPSAIRWHACMPVYHWVNDRSSLSEAEHIRDAIIQNLLPLGHAKVIVHEGLYLPYYLRVAHALHLLPKLEGFEFWHQAHSLPAAARPEEAHLRYRATLPHGHRLITLTQHDVPTFAEYYQVPQAAIDVVPNSLDFREWFHFPDEANYLATKHDLLGADICCVYPFSTPRWRAKGLQKLLELFMRLKETGKTVRLVLPNAHVLDASPVSVIERTVMVADLELGKEVILTSQEIKGTRRHGLSRDNIRALYQVSNLFVLPSMTESYSLVTVEAAMSGCLLVVNRDLPQLQEVLEDHPEVIWASLGTLWTDGQTDLQNLAEIIIERLERHSLKRRITYKHSRGNLGSCLERALSVNASNG